MPSTIPFFALTTRGLEAISANEIGALPGVTVIQQGYRRVAGICYGAPASLMRLYTVDDVFVHVATWNGIARTRDILTRIRALCARLDLQSALSTCAAVRPIPEAPAISVTVSFVGSRNYTAPEMKDAIAGELARRRLWRYEPDDRRADLNLRVFIERDVAYVGLRLAKAPLHERAYRGVHRPGALKPSVAAAMLVLAGVAPGQRVLDPCCGTGTIAIEAALRGAVAFGSDVDPAAIAAATANAATAGVAPTFREMDMRTLAWDTASMHRIVANLPWNRQIAIAGELAELYERALAEMRRILAPGGRIVLLTNQPDLVYSSAFHCLQRIEISLFGQTPTILALENHTRI